jgi:hypothetical protein
MLTSAPAVVHEINRLGLFNAVSLAVFLASKKPPLTAIGKHLDLFDRERRALLGGGPVLAAQCCGNLGDAILKLTVGIAERLRRWRRQQFMRVVLFRPAT